MTDKYPSEVITLPGFPRGRVMCANDRCYGRKIWNLAAGEAPNCIMCSAAWHAIEASKKEKRK